MPYAVDHPFPLENLPWAVFSISQDSASRCAVRIADQLLDLASLSTKHPEAFAQGPFNAQEAQALFSQPTLNAYLSLPRSAHRAFRAFLQHVLSPRSSIQLESLQELLIPVESAQLHLPIQVGDYTDFCASKYHCTTTGRLMFNDPNRPLEDQWYQLPIAYHSRSSSLVVSGTNFHRPRGIFRTKPGSPDVEFNPSKRMDFELEVAYVMGGAHEINPLGQPVALENAEEAIFGMMLMNDWSARDIQGYEMNPLGPFTGKNFATTLSPYLVELDALEPFRTASPEVEAEHTPFAYLDHKGQGSTWDVKLQAFLAPGTSASGKEEKTWTKITDTSLKHVYWTAAQMVAHHTVTGCNLRAADTFATGTVSGPFEEEHSEALLIEACKAGRKPIPLAARKGVEAETRCFLEDGDEVKIVGYAFDAESKLRIGLRECSGQLLPAIQL